MKLIVVLCLVAPCFSGSFREDIMSHPNWKLFQKSECGIRKNSVLRIVKGEIARIESFPWLGQLLQKNMHQVKYACGVALILPYYALTAAHCVHGKERKTKFIRFGDNVNINRLDCPNCGPKIHRIEQIAIHKDFNASNFVNDIAVIRLEEPVKYQLNIRPVCLPKDDILENKFIAEKVEIAGWGVDSSETLSSVLKYVTLPMRDRCVCNSVYDRELVEGQYCIGVETGEDTCRGDSGSPVVWSRREYFIDKHYIIGISPSKNADCGLAPSVYTNINVHMKWILDNIYDDDEQQNEPSYKPLPQISTPKTEIQSTKSPDNTNIIKIPTGNYETTTDIFHQEEYPGYTANEDTENPTENYQTSPVVTESNYESEGDSAKEIDVVSEVSDNDFSEVDDLASRTENTVVSDTVSPEDSDENVDFSENTDP